MDSKPFYEKIPLDFDFPFYYTSVTFTSFSFHWHEPVEMIYVFSGSINISVRGHVFEAVQGDIIIINSELIHGFYDAIPETCLDIYQFGLEFFDSLLGDLIDKKSQMIVFDKMIRINESLDQNIYRPLLKLLWNIKTEYNEKKEGYHLAIKTLLFQVALIFVRDIPVPPIIPQKIVRRNYSRQIMEKVLSYIYEHFDDPDFSLDDAADVAALSKFYFTRFFKGQTGQTFHNYLNRVRINKAKEYLIETDMTITDISLLCGFSSLNTFNRLFRIYNRTTPSYFRMVKQSTNKETNSGIVTP
jgi:AraC-like DNA-binding protein